MALSGGGHLYSLLHMHPPQGSVIPCYAQAQSQPQTAVAEDVNEGMVEQVWARVSKGW